MTRRLGAAALFFGILSRVFSKECGGRIQTTISKIHSPGYPARPSFDEKCQWNIQAASEEICHLEIEFVSGDLKSSLLTISKLSMTGSLAGIRLFPLSGNLSITYEAGDNPGQGFEAILRQRLCTDTLSTQCGSVLKGLENSIIGPGHWHQYCNYLVEKNSDNICQLEIDFVKFEVGNNGDCEKNSLLIGNEELCSKIEGSRVYTFNGNTIKISSKNKVENIDKFILKLKQQPCQKESEFSDESTKADDFSSTSLHYAANSMFDRGACCNRQFHSEQHFFLSSPGFPLSNTIDCAFTIRRYSLRTVAIEIRFKYFWVGERDQYNYNCRDGYMEIDGDFFCGCLTGLKWIIPFSNTQFSDYKSLWLKLDRLNFNRFTGFIIEVIQIEDTNYVPRYKRQLYRALSDANAGLNYGSVQTSVDENADLNSQSVHPGVNHSKNQIETFPSNITESDVSYVKSEEGSLISNHSTRKTARVQRSEMFSRITDFSCLNLNPRDWILLLQQTIWAQLYCPSTVLPPVSTTGSNPYAEKLSECSVFNKNHGWIHLSSRYRLSRKEDNNYHCFSIIPNKDHCFLQITFHRADTLGTSNCIDSYIQISGIGRICEPLLPRSSVRTGLRNGTFDIIIKRKNEDEYILLEYQQLSCDIVHRHL